MKQKVKLYRIGSSKIKEVYPVGTKVKIDDVGQLYSIYDDAFDFFGIKYSPNCELNAPIGYSNMIFYVKNYAIHSNTDSVIYHIQSENGKYDLVIDECGLIEYNDDFNVSIDIENDYESMFLLDIKDKNNITNVKLTKDQLKTLNNCINDVLKEFNHDKR